MELSPREKDKLLVFTAALPAGALSVAEESDTQVSIHSDKLNESGFFEDTIAAEDVLHDLGPIRIFSSDRPGACSLS